MEVRIVGAAVGVRPLQQEGRRAPVLGHVERVLRPAEAECGWLLAASVLLRLELCHQLGGSEGGLLAGCDLGRHVATRLERRIEGTLLLASLLVGGSLELRQLRLHGGQLGLAVGKHLRLGVGLGTGRVQRHPSFVEGGLLRPQARTQVADLAGEQLILVRDGEQVADLGGGRVKGIGREDQLEQRRLTALIGGAHVLLEQRFTSLQIRGLQLDLRRHLLELPAKGGDLGLELGQAGRDLGDLAPHLFQQAVDPVVLGSHRRELGLRCGNGVGELRRLRLQRGQGSALRAQGVLERLLLRLGVSERVRGLGRVAGRVGDDARSDHQQGNQQDGQMRSSPHATEFRGCSISPKAPLRAPRRMLPGRSERVT